MKKFILILTGVICFTISSQAQVGIGGRGIFGVDGNAYGGFEFSAQKLDSWELDLGFLNESWKATGLKLFPLIDRRNFGLYLGAGLGAAYYEPYDEVYFNFAGNLGSFIALGPIQLGLDWRPEWNFYNPPHRDLGFNLALSGRWIFGKK